VWIKDLNTFTITAHDPNGTSVDSFAVLFDTGSTLWKGSRTNSISGISFEDTSKAGPRQIKVKVKDMDDLWTEKSFSLNVKLGRPIISLANFGDTIQWERGVNGALDTMFYTWKSGDTYVFVDTSDSNGNIIRYDWDRGDDGTIDYPNTN